MVLRNFRFVLLLIVVAVTPVFGSASLLVDERRHPDDLAFSGQWMGWPEGAVRFAAREALAKIEGVKVMVDRAVPSLPPAEVTVLPFRSLLAILPLAADADGIVLRCEDRWESWLPVPLIEAQEPYLILYYNGKSPGQGDGWPIVGGVEAMAPYHAYVSPVERPGFVDETPYGMISATQVIEIHGTSAARRYAPFHAGALARLEGAAARGRELFLANCNTCHQGPRGVGGNVSQRPLILLRTHAMLNTAYFRQIVADPTVVYPKTVMPKHGHFTEETFAALEAFLRATKDSTGP